MATPRVNFCAEDTSYGGFLLLKEERFRIGHGAELHDDGIIDEIAVERRVNGDRVRLTAREVVCVVAEAARRGRSDGEIAELLGRDNDRHGAQWIMRMRERNRIEPGVALNDGFAAWDARRRNTLTVVAA